MGEGGEGVGLGGLGGLLEGSWVGRDCGCGM